MERQGELSRFRGRTVIREIGQCYSHTKGAARMNYGSVRRYNPLRGVRNICGNGKAGLLFNVYVLYIYRRNGILSKPYYNLQIYAAALVGGTGSHFSTGFCKLYTVISTKLH